MMQRAGGAATNFSADTLSDEDREMFLRGRGLSVEIGPSEVAHRRAEWPDRDVLDAKEVGLG
ncbi:hypothetical protein J2Y69_001172 [Microbacterium resistens]|uniref:Uncharacterized protein n=1 Tax=Microbacterium resistens TaxID=156977 RepID=A0ABU1SAD4_9MICO|nr:hypothetical protein [Microbacterium resistens]MDR6866579.1 hypothetical protein [Microbacterium resistens]